MIDEYYYTNIFYEKSKKANEIYFFISFMIKPTINIFIIADV